MKVIIRGKNIDLTEGIETKINKKLSVLDKYFIMSDNVEAKVLIRVYPVGQKIEVTIPTEYVLLRGDLIRANKFDMDSINRTVIAHYDQPEEVKKEIAQWYEELIEMMRSEDISHISLKEEASFKS